MNIFDENTGHIYPFIPSTKIINKANFNDLSFY